MPIVIDHIALKDILGLPLFEMEVSGSICGGSAVIIIHTYRNVQNLFSKRRFYFYFFRGCLNFAVRSHSS